MEGGLNLQELVERAARCAIVNRDGSTIYRNDRKGAELFERRFPGIREIVRVVESSKELEIAGAAEAAVGTPGIVDFLLRIRASLRVVGKRDLGEHDVVTKALTEPLKMALAELDLERDHQIADGRSEVILRGRPFVRTGSELQPCGFGDDDVLNNLLTRLPEPAAAEIVRRKTDYEKNYGSTRLVYAASEPPMAAIFIPPWSEPGVEGSSSAAYPPGAPYHRVAFSRVLDYAQGVTFLDLHYIVDLWPPG